MDGRTDPTLCTAIRLMRGVSLPFKPFAAAGHRALFILRAFPHIKRGDFQFRGLPVNRQRFQCARDRANDGVSRRRSFIR